MEFTIDKVDLTWQGKLTRGTCWIRGTAIQFAPPVVVLHDEDAWDGVSVYELDPYGHFDSKLPPPHSSVRVDSPQEFKDICTDLLPANDIPCIKEGGISYDLSSIKGYVGYGMRHAWVVLAPPEVWKPIFAELDEVTAFAARHDFTLEWV